MNAMFVCLHGPWGKHHGINYRTALIVHLIIHLHTSASSIITQAFEGYFDF
jgi:hypothetical protein